MVLFKFPREKFLPLLANSIKSKWNVFKKVAMWDYFVPFQVIKFDSPKKTDLFTITTDVFYGGKSKAILEYNEGFGELFELSNKRKTLPSWARAYLLYPVLNLELATKTEIEIKCRGDGREYQIVLIPKSFFEDFYIYHDFKPDNEWKSYKFKFENFIANREGDDIGKVQHREMRLIAVGIGVEDHRVGNFKLEVEHITLH